MGFGTDSGAMPQRLPGFAEHRELELLVQAGLTPLQALHTATGAAAQALKLPDRMASALICCWSAAVQPLISAIRARLSAFGRQALGWYEGWVFGQSITRQPIRTSTHFRALAKQDTPIRLLHEWAGLCWSGPDALPLATAKASMPST